MAGIEVLKVESPDRPDGSRSGPAAFFDLINANKAGCALDLQRPRDRAAFERLLDGADIVLESARPRALEQLGYDAASWVEAGAGRLWVSITGYGRQAPQRDWIAFGDDAAIAAGLAWSPAAHSGPPSPCFCGDAIADPLTALHAAAIVLAHLRGGRGGLLELSLVDICARAAGFSAGRLELPIEAWDGPPKDDKDDDRVGSSGSDRWCVIWEDQRIPVEAPRARSAIGTAPVLRAPGEALLASWSATC
jgi:crotonobetainyl-CoA:carnitine CoA-transferase CaiB-like acyl-CoA transferase